MTLPKNSSLWDSSLHVYTVSKLFIFKLLKSEVRTSAIFIYHPFMRSFLPFLLLFSLFLSVSPVVQSQEKKPLTGNALCLDCHTHQTITFHNSVTDKEVKRMMNPLYILDKDHLAAGVHAKFQCTDCHSSDYSQYPHKAELKLEPLGSCLDCHGGDEKYAAYQFEKIEEQFKKSVHFEKSGSSFTCSKCHNQHYYQPKSRTSNQVSEIVLFSNEMCLTCHSNNVKFQLVSDSLKPALSQIHQWLPNQDLHFKNVRCIECHTQVVDSLAVSHNILPKEKALKSCIECHSRNSMLKASLYKYKNLQSRSEGGKINTILSNTSYVIGAYQNPFLNYTSILIFLLALTGICIHLIFRIIKK